MRSVRLTVALASLLALSGTAAFGQSIVGKWTGRIEMNMASLPKATNDVQRKNLGRMVATVKALRFALDLKKDKTFTISIPAAGANKSPRKIEGTWTQAGARGMLLMMKENGKPKKQYLPMTISKAGNRISVVPKDSVSKGKMLFTRARILG